LALHESNWKGHRFEVEKNISILKPGQGEEREIHDMRILPGTTVLEAIRETGVQSPSHWILEDEFGLKLVSGQNLYEAAEEGQKFYALPDEARVAA
jgi:hypothetical protein